MAPRRKPASERLARVDGWQSLVTGLGTDRDRRTSLTFGVSRVPYESLVQLYRGDDMAARIVDLLPGEMLRRGFRVTINDDKAASEAVANRLDELNVVAHVERALCWARAFGGAGILMGANDGATDLAKPLDFEAIRSLDWLTVLDCRELQPAEYYTDPAHPRYGEPSIYSITPNVTTDQKSQGKLVHETRILRFDGVVITRRQLQENNGWGDSVLQRVHEVLRDFGAAWGGTAHLLTEFAQGVLSVPGLLDLLSTKKGQAELLTRLQALELMRSTVRAMVVDGGNGEGEGAENFERKQTPLSGLAELLDKMSLRVAAAARTPVSLLMGQAPAGLNATGASDIRFFYDNVAAVQGKELRPQLNRLVKILLRAKNGPTKGAEPASWKVVFPPLWELTDLEKADLRNKQGATDVAYVQAGILDPSEVAVSRFGGEEYSTDTHLDLETRAAMAPAEAAPPAEPPVRGDSALLEGFERGTFHADAAPQGVAIVLPVPPAIATSLALPGYVAASDLHLTVAFIGKLETLPTDVLARVRPALQAFARRQPPLIGVVSGMGRFSIPDGPDAVHLSFDAPGLPAWREELLRALASAGIAPAMRHGFDPHITVAYVPGTETIGIGHQAATPITFASVDLWVGPARETFALAGAMP